MGRKLALIMACIASVLVSMFVSPILGVIVGVVWGVVFYVTGKRQQQLREVHHYYHDTSGNPSRKGSPF